MGRRRFLFLVTVMIFFSMQTWFLTNADMSQPDTSLYGTLQEIKPCDGKPNWPTCLPENRDCICCEKYKMAICLGNTTKLNYIPSFPAYVEKLKFENNYLHMVSSSTFKNLRNLSITFLSLSSNNIISVSKDAFSGFNQLKTLDLSNNFNINITQCLVAIGTITVKKLYLNKVGLKQINERDFRFLSKSNITTLSLGQNLLKKFNGSALSNIPELQVLNVSGNIISTFNLGGLANLTKLNISGNKINLNKGSANFCINKTQKSLIPKLNVLNLSNNLIFNLAKKTFLCLNNLTHLYLGGNPIENLDGFIFEPLKNLKKLSLNNLQRLHKISSNAFTEATFTNLAFTNINRKVNMFKSKTLFRDCGRLTHLDLSWNVLPKKSKDLQRLFKPLTNLQNLKLNNVKFDVMPTNFFTKFSYLQKLYLRDNHLISWSGRDVFGNMKSLTSLYLENNKISVVSESLFTEQLLQSLINISFSFNPLRCECENLWFRDYVRDHDNKGIKFLGFNTYHCSNYENEYFKNFNPTKKSCEIKNIIIPTVTSVSAILVIFSITFCLIYKMRWHIRYRLYLLKTYKDGYKKIPEGTNCTNRAFVVYADEDRLWVHKELLPKLEEENKIKLCIRMRDFVVGGITVEDMVEHFHQCNKVILVLSDNFANSEWCKFQLALVHDRLLSEGKSMMVVVMIEEISIKNMSKYLFWLISVNTHFDWSEDPSAKNLFWEQLVTAMKLPIEDKGNEIDLVLQDSSWTPFPAIQSERLCESCTIL